MKCHECNGETSVINSRNDPQGKRRRRMCVECGERYSTVEIDEEEYEKLRAYFTSARHLIDVFG